MKRHRLSLSVFLGVQLVIASAVALAFVGLSNEAEVQFRQAVEDDQD